MLLRSRPDTVHRFLSRKTQTSTPLTKGSPTRRRPDTNHHPCYSGLQVQGTANSPAARKFDDIYLIIYILQQNVNHSYDAVCVKCSLALFSVSVFYAKRLLAWALALIEHAAVWACKIRMPHTGALKTHALQGF